MFLQKMIKNAKHLTFKQHGFILISTKMDNVRHPIPISQYNKAEHSYYCTNYCRSVDMACNV